MFLNDAQACRALQLLLVAIKDGRLWSESGPSDEAVRILNGETPASHGERVMVQVAFDFWNGEGKAKFADMIGVLDSNNQARAAALWVAYDFGQHAIEDWIDRAQRMLDNLDRLPTSKRPRDPE